MAASWRRYLTQLPELSRWKIPRAVRKAEALNLQLHGFADASEKAYGACFYVRWTHLDQHHSLLLCSKSRVAPLKSVSLPRLELCAALLLAKLYRVVTNALKLKFEFVRFWSDSTITLAWINSSPHELKTFIANRVSEVQDLTSPSDWGHVSSEQNPGDYVSRGQLPEEFINNSQWKSGPVWLQQGSDVWPNHETREIEVPERRITSCGAIVGDQGHILWDRFSSFTRLQRVFAYCLRFIKKSCRQTQQTGSLSNIELQESTKKMISLVQQEEFGNEFDRVAKSKNVSRTSKLRRLNPFIEDGLLRVGGRIWNAELQYDQKCPILLPKEHPFTDLVIRHTHEKQLHAGINATLYAIRLNYWPIDGRSCVKKLYIIA